MVEKIYHTSCGSIHYWTSEDIKPDEISLIFLPGLTADHRLFDKQIEYFEDRYNIMTWDAPGHNLSRPFELSFTLMDKACWLNEILDKEGINRPVIIGQSMGGYVAQCYMQKFPGKLAGFISIDSAPLQLKYMRKWELNIIKKLEPVYRWYPWKLLLKHGSIGTAVSDYGRAIMWEMMSSYSANPKEYAKLAGHGYRILAQAIEAGLPYEIDCPAMLVCGEKDMAGETKAFNKKWTKETGIDLKWIPNAGHNSNTDRPDIINPLIEQFVIYQAK